MLLPSLAVPGWSCSVCQSYVLLRMVPSTVDSPWRGHVIPPQASTHKYATCHAYRNKMGAEFISLQYGVPLEKWVEKFTNMHFEPAGMTDDPDIRIASSVMDYVFRRLALRS